MANGSFVLENNQVGDSLTLGLLGYEKTFLVLNESHFKDNFTIVLKGKTILLDELVITEQIDALNSISKVDFDTINNINFGKGPYYANKDDFNTAGFVDSTESRLQNELQPVEEIHFTPGTPFFFKTNISYRF